MSINYYINFLFVKGFNVLLLIIFCSVFLVQSQEDFDDSFLDSLPEDVRNELILKTETKELMEEKQYRRPSTFINKPSEDSESKRFGAQIFKMMQTTLMPTNEPNFDGSYILDFGDVLELQLIGQKSSITTVPVSRDGSISIPDIGKIFISGLSLDKAYDLVKEKVNSSFIGVDAHLTLTNIRDIQIIVAGNVYNPGPYTLNGNSNIFHALNVSGGPSDIGSFRSINLLRDNKIIANLDLYEIFIYGRSGFGPRLRSGDLIFVEPVLNLVSIYGGVKRPGTYELKDDENLYTILDFGNGISNKSDLNEIRLFRLDNGKIKNIKLSALSELNKFQPRDNDRITIREHPYRTVTISGAVTNPGDYVLNEGDGIRNLIVKAGGYRDNAYPFGGILENKATKKINQMAIDDLYRQFLNAITSNISSSQNIDSITMLMNELKEVEPTGRVTAEFNLTILNQYPDKDIKLQDGDEILIPEKIDHIYVYGEVSNQGTVMFDKDMSFDDYIIKKGGYNNNADKKNIYVLNPNGETYKLNNAKNIFLSKNSNLSIYPGSIIFVPRKTSNALLATQTAQSYASILGSIGVSLASISVLKD